MTDHDEITDIAELPAWLQHLARETRKPDLRPYADFAPQVTGDSRAAAVLILFGEGAGGGDVLFIRRAETLAAHAGQVAFPGGGVEPQDVDIVATALREAQEETGLDPIGVQVIAVMPEVFLPVSGFMVTPVLGYWRKPSEVFAVDPAETAAVARVPLSALTDSANRFRLGVSGSPWQGPAFEVDELLIWGFTGYLMSVVLELGGWEKEWDHGDIRYIDVPFGAS